MEQNLTILQYFTFPVINSMKSSVLAILLVRRCVCACVNYCFPVVTEDKTCDLAKEDVAVETVTDYSKEIEATKEETETVKEEATKEETEKEEATKEETEKEEATKKETETIKEDRIAEEATDQSRDQSHDQSRDQSHDQSHDSQDESSLQPEVCSVVKYCYLH